MLRAPKVVVIDDDPTGSQTVHSCLLLLAWDVSSLRQALRHSLNLFFILANTRTLEPSSAEKVNRSIVSALSQALYLEGLTNEDVILISRGDSTLRGHGFLEPSVLNESFGPFDATFHLPAFLEGGRTTVDCIHLLNGSPVHLSSFAKDRLFGFRTSYLPQWLSDKSLGLISPESVFQIHCHELESISGQTFSDLLSRLNLFNNNVSVIVNVSSYNHLYTFAQAVLELRQHKRFLFRSAASFIKAISPQINQSRSSSSLAGLRLRDSHGSVLPGFVLVGSHVSLSDSQLNVLLTQEECVGLELSVSTVFSIFTSPNSDVLLPDLVNNYVLALSDILSSGFTPVFYSQRGELFIRNPSQSRRFALYLASLMSKIVSFVVPDLGYLISKGGTTTQTLLSEGLNLSSVMLEGQILPGLSLVRPLSGSSFKLPIVTFPGNLGNSNTLFDAWKLMESG